MNRELAADLQSLMAFELVRLGKTQITVGGLVAAILIVAVSLAAARLAAGAIRRRARTTNGSQNAAANK